MQVTYEQVGKHIIAEHQTTLVCGVGLNTDEALAHLEERMAAYAVDSKKPFFEARRAISNQIFREIIFSKDSESENRITQLIAGLRALNS